MAPPPMASREAVREARFSEVWNKDLEDVFADVAPYYDRANDVASLGRFPSFRRRLVKLAELAPHQKVLDVCAGTNAVGIELLQREPTLDVHAIDRSTAMQKVGQVRAGELGFQIKSTIGDVHRLPFPDAHFDLVTLQFASRHLRVREVFSEIRRVLKPGGHFYHSDMLRPSNRVVRQLYYTYLRGCLNVTAFLFGSGKAANNARQYFLDALDMFYTPEEMSILLRELGFEDVYAETAFYGMVGFHRAARPY